MFRTSIVTIFVLFVALTGQALADHEDLVLFNLTLAGYQIGMTYDEALRVRPLDYLEEAINHSPASVSYVGHASHVILDEFPTDIMLYFRDNRVQKILVRFHPAAMPQMVRFFQETLGKGENLSRILTPTDGSKIRQTSFRWDFPTAKIFLVGNSTNTDFATASLIAKKPEQSLQDPGEDSAEKGAAGS